MRTAASKERGEVDAGAPIGLWESGAAQCVLCGSRRRVYLFVVGDARMTQCHECGLISRTGSVDRLPSRSYELDSESRQALLAACPAGRVLQLVHGGGGLPPSDRHQFVTVDISGSSDALDSIQPASFGAAFVNGVIEQVANPVAFLRRVRTYLKKGGGLLCVTRAKDIADLSSDEFPAHSFTPATLLRLAQAAGFSTRSCGVLGRSLDTPAVDGRLGGRPPFPWLSRFVESIPGQRVEVSSGLMELRATVGEPRARPKVSIIVPVFNEAGTFIDTFHKIHEAAIEGVDREIIIVESNSTDGSRELVRSVEGSSGVRVVYEDKPQGKGHAVRAGMAVADGDIFLIQDADSEYDVADYDIVLEPLLHHAATFVLGSRHMGGRTWKIRQFANAKILGTTMNLAHQGFTALTNLLYQSEMRDPATMYKVFRRECVDGIVFRRDRFDFDYELVCKLIRRGHIPVEVPVNYRSRSYAEGKKVRFFRDPVTWVRTIVSSRFEPLSLSRLPE